MNKEIINQYIQHNKERFIEELLDLLRIPSISADPAYKADVQRTAEKVKQRLLEAGAEKVEVCATAGHPIVYGEKIINQNLPTVLVYGHYDVQPVDPIELWHSQPFEPVIKKTPLHPKGAIFARGSADDKGQAYMHIKALELMLKTNTLPCNIKLMIEGEEEVGSDNLGVFVTENKEKLKADIILISDTAILANDTPSITVGLRGLSYVEVEVTGPNRDLHSGIYGGAVANPINILCEMIASLKDENNKITIPGFYDDVATLTDREKAELAKAPFNEVEYKKHLDISAVHGEKDFSTMERSSIRPTLDVNGIWGGYIGEGAKTVLPSKAFAKISMRLVPHQSSKKITELFKNHFESIAPAGVKVQVKPHHGGDPVVTPSNNPGYLAAEKAMHETFGKKSVPVRGGGSIPIVALFEKELGIKSVLMGFSLDTDAIHSPNEHYGIFNYIKGIETIPLFFYHYAQLFKK
ncbi:MAG: dipeptidase [Flavobacteriales bacterium]|nr:dipeptidase [Flavobacteriales bacterium]